MGAVLCVTAYKYIYLDVSQQQSADLRSKEPRTGWYSTFSGRLKHTTSHLWIHCAASGQPGFSAASKLV